MDRNGIAAAILSLSAPALSIAPDEATAQGLCRRMNEYSSLLQQQHPNRFGFFATLPVRMDDMAASLAEVVYSLDELKADGITLLTSYKHRYLGDAAFTPLWQALDQRGAVVFIHPTLENMQGGLTNPLVPRPIVDFPHETTRTAIHMIFADVPRRFPNCKFILSHGGGTLPYIATRVAHQCADVGLYSASAEDFLKQAKSFYFDLALTGYEVAVEALLKFAGASHILYGSDFPFARERTSQAQVRGLNEMRLVESDDHHMRQGAALHLFPRLRSHRT